MLLFLRKIILFSLPLSLLFVFPALVVYFGREYVSASDVVEIQKKFPKTLMSFAYNPTSFVPYKIALVQDKNPTIVALGTSRVFQIRKEFFIDPDSFANAGGAGRSLDDITYFVQQLPSDTKVKVIILGLDNETLFEKFESKHFRVEEPFAVRSFDMIALTSRRMYLDYLAHKFNLSQLRHASASTTNVGLVALINGDGFRPDGSYKYTQSESNQRLQEDVQADIQKTVKELQVKSLQSEDPRYKELATNMQKLSVVLDMCKKRGITVIGFTPPYPKAIYNSMIDKGGFEKDLLVTVPLQLQTLFSEHGDQFFDLSLVDTFKGNEHEFVDAVHGSDVMYLRMMIYMASNSSTLKGLVDVEHLKKMLANTQGAFLPF